MGFRHASGCIGVGIIGSIIPCLSRSTKTICGHLYWALGFRTWALSLGSIRPRARLGLVQDSGLRVLGVFLGVGFRLAFLKF